MSAYDPKRTSASDCPLFISAHPSAASSMAKRIPVIRASG
jgi:hypothetical protein